MAVARSRASHTYLIVEVRTGLASCGRNEHRDLRSRTSVVRLVIGKRVQVSMVIPVTVRSGRVFPTASRIQARFQQSAVGQLLWRPARFHGLFETSTRKLEKTSAAHSWMSLAKPAENGAALACRTSTVSQ